MFRALRRIPAIRLALFGIAAIGIGGCQHNRVTAIDQGVPVDYRQRHPIMVSPQGAYVASQCGQWPHDLGPSDGAMSNLNKTYWNFGCATQQNLAAMVAQPSDLLHPRAQGELDSTRRQTALARYRRGESPGPHTIHQPIQPLTDVKAGVRGGGG
ncbi:CpaD family pilus assembly lipoprotein [Phreatobacter stygius]|nr:CpaD family pilus assembly lipoprotein [Phreatobacter stygius]